MRLSYVPRSCCVRDRFWRYIDVDTCQKWMVGPPGTLDPGSATNHVLYYQVISDRRLIILNYSLISMKSSRARMYPDLECG